MIGFLIFYIIFSELFAFGYVEFHDGSRYDTWYWNALCVLITLILAPIMLPFNLGWCVRRNSK